ncbi:MAG: hypothetical protein IJ764_03600 [Bacteroidales bacterium]|nr:hypothetical protein [Bacteroidales bacterium]
MTREEKRIQVVDACIAQQQHIADIAKQEMDSAQQQSNDYGANVDRYDSYRTKMMRSRDMYAKQYSNALEAIRRLQELRRLKPFDSAVHGAVVITDKQCFFLSIGAGKFMVPFHPQSPRQVQVPFFAVSAQTPIYLAIKGKHAGDTFTLNGLTQTITEIY